MFDALEQKWKQTEQVGEIQMFLETSDEHDFSSHSKEPPPLDNGNKGATVGKVKWVNKPEGQLFLIS